ncbi:MAG TPA: hypothetical protein VMR70_12655 [Flavisolibacter sp.]|nr:hypothetical protein [Flavisolibacter sp.]
MTTMFPRMVLLALLLVLYSCDDAKIAAIERARTDSANRADPDKESLPPDSLLYEASFGDGNPSRVVIKPKTASAKAVVVLIHEMEGYGADEVFARAAADTLEAVLNSNGFKRAVLNTAFTYENKGLNAQQIYDLIMKAHEEDGEGGTDGVLDLRLRTISLEEDGQRWMNACNRNTVGIDGSGTGVSAVCPGWLRSAVENGHYSWLAAHYMHEYMHLLRFRHSAQKLQSVPYKIDAIVEKLAENPALRY